MKRAFLLLLAVLLAPAVFAQTPVTADNFTHFSLTGSATGFLGASGGNQPANIAGGWFNITQRVSIGAEMITIPTVATFKFGMVQYQLPLANLVGKKLTGHFLFDASKVAVGFQGGVGNLVQSNQNVSKIAGTVGVTLSYPLSDHLSMQIISAQYVRGGVAGTSGLVSSPSAAAISSGLGINF